MNKTAEQLATESLAEVNRPEFKDLIRDEINIKLLEMLPLVSEENKEAGPMEISIKFGRKCYELGKKDALIQSSELNEK